MNAGVQRKSTQKKKETKTLEKLIWEKTEKDMSPAGANITPQLPYCHHPYITNTHTNTQSLTRRTRNLLNYLARSFLCAAAVIAQSLKLLGVCVKKFALQLKTEISSGKGQTVFRGQRTLGSTWCSRTNNTWILWRKLQNSTWHV